QALELVGLRASLGGLRLRFDTSRVLRLEPVAEEAAEGRADHEADRTSRSRTDHRTATETDRLVLRPAALLVRPPGRRGGARHSKNQQLLVVHLSLLGFLVPCRHWIALKRKGGSGL